MKNPSFQKSSPARFLWLAGTLFVLGVSLLVVGWHLRPPPLERPEFPPPPGDGKPSSSETIREPEAKADPGSGNPSSSETFRKYERESRPSPSVLRIQREIDPSGFQTILEYRYWTGTDWTGAESEAEIFSPREQAKSAAASLTAPPGWEGIAVIPSFAVK